MRNSEKSETHTPALSTPSTLKYPSTYIKKKISDQRTLVTNEPFPHETKSNNLKSKQYFSKTESSDIKSALSSYRKKIQNKHHSTSSTVNTISPSKQKNSMVLDRDLVKYAEPRSTPKISYKVKPKNFDENIDTDSDDDLNENCAIYNGKTKSIGHLTFTNSSNNLTNDSINNNKKERLNTTDIEQVDIKIEKNINFQSILYVENLFMELIKDIEINKMEVYDNKISIIDDFLEFFNKKENYDNLFILFDCGVEFNKNSIQKICKDFFMQQIVFWYVLKVIGIVKKEKESYLSGIKNIIFYFHQNFIAFLFILVTKTQDNVAMIKKFNEENKNFFEKCKKKINDSKTWLTKTNYKKCLVSNNKITRNIIKNTINQLHLYFKDENLYQTSTIDIEAILNLFVLFIKSVHKTRLESTIETLNTSTSIQALFESVYTSSKQDGNIKTPLAPFLPPKPDNSPFCFTLVLDLDETLVHYTEDNESAYVQVRPGAEDFIEDLSNFFEIVIFTAAQQKYADLVLEGIDKNSKISYKLYRQHTISVNNANVKDLDKLGRDISKVIIVDNYQDNFCFQPKNGLHIKNFEGEEEDHELDDLKEDLLQLIKDNPKDVRDYLGAIQEKMDQRAAEVNPELLEHAEDIKIVDQNENEAVVEEEEKLN